MPALGLLVLRIALAVVLSAHGAHDLLGLFAGPGIGPGGPADAGARFEAAGFTPGVPLALLSGSIQLAGGFLVGVGWLTRWAALAIAATTALTAWRTQLPWGFFLNWTVEPARGHGIEYALVLIGALCCLVFAGGGAWSIDGQREKAAASRAAGRARLRGR